MPDELQPVGWQCWRRVAVQGLGLSMTNMAIACAVLSSKRDLLCLHAGLSALLPVASVLV